MTVAEVRDYLGTYPYSGCDCGGLVEFRREDVVEVLADYEYSSDGYDSESGILVRLTSGKFATATESSDSSGHG